MEEKLKELKNHNTKKRKVENIKPTEERKMREEEERLEKQGGGRQFHLHTVDFLDPSSLKQHI